MKVIAVVIEVGILKSSYIVTNFHDYFTGSAGTNFPPFISLKGFCKVNFSPLMSPSLYKRRSK